MDPTRSLQATLSGEARVTFWSVITQFYGEERLVVVAALFWVTDRSFARFFITAAVLQYWANALLKVLFAVTRPESTGSFQVLGSSDDVLSRPSGHAQGSAVTYTLLARHVRRWWFTVLAVAVIALVGISRIYLGLHWWEDVVLGWAVGIGFVVAMAALWPWLSALATQLAFGVRVALAVLVPILLLVAWEVIPGMAAVTPTTRYSVLGALIGIWLGTLLEERWVGFDHRGPISWQAIKLVLGIALVMGVRLSLKELFPPGNLADGVRYVFVGTTASLVAPWLFVAVSPAAARRPRFGIT